MQLSLPNSYVFILGVALFALTSATSNSLEKSKRLTVSLEQEISERQSEPSCECGLNGRKRIVGGTQAIQNFYPWLVAIYWSTGDLMCGGAVLNHNFILSASHCFSGVNPTDIYIILGDYITGTTSDGPATQMGVEKIIMHEDFGKLSKVDSDIALLKTKRTLTFSERIQAICLPLANTDFIGKTGVAAGWGTTSFGGTESNVLLEVDIPILEDEICEEKFTKYYTENMICGGYLEGGKDACQGDSGGPLVLPDENGVYEVCGVISFGRGCATPGFPGVYTKVTNYLTWIANKTSGTKMCKRPDKNQPQCGAANPAKSRQIRIVGGINTSPNQYPWTAVITTSSQGKFELRCGANLIGDSWLLTTARCIYGFSPSSLSVVLGDHDIGRYERVEVQRIVSEVIIHPGFQAQEQFTHDIALIKIPTVKFTREISPICLPPGSWDSQVLQGVEALTTGWGKNNRQTTVEQQLFMKIISNSECRRFYGTKVTNDYICAGGEAGQDICNNDFGGQLSVTSIDGLYRLVGLSAFNAKDNCGGGYPAGFTRVTSYLEWITDSTGIVTFD